MFSGFQCTFVSGNAVLSSSSFVLHLLGGHSCSHLDLLQGIESALGMLLVSDIGFTV